MIYFFFSPVLIREKISYVIEMRAHDLISALKSLNTKRFVIRNGRSENHSRFLNSLIISIILLPLSIAYFFWIHLPFVMYSIFYAYMILFLQVVSRRSKHTKRLLIHVSALSKIGNWFLLITMHWFSDAYRLELSWFDHPVKLTLLFTLRYSFELSWPASVHKVLRHDRALCANVLWSSEKFMVYARPRFEFKSLYFDHRIYRVTGIWGKGGWIPSGVSKQTEDS